MNFGAFAEHLDVGRPREIQSRLLLDLVLLQAAPGLPNQRGDIHISKGHL
jgi:hypothetical protein